MMFSLEVIILDYFFKPHWLFPNQENKKTPWVIQGVFEMTSSLLSSVHQISNRSTFETQVDAVAISFDQFHSLFCNLSKFPQHPA